MIPHYAIAGDAAFHSCHLRAFFPTFLMLPPLCRAGMEGRHAALRFHCSGHAADVTPLLARKRH
jgi:hypothetical protein